MYSVAIGVSVLDQFKFPNTELQSRKMSMSICISDLTEIIFLQDHECAWVSAAIMHTTHKISVMQHRKKTQTDVFGTVCNTSVVSHLQTGLQNETTARTTIISMYIDWEHNFLFQETFCHRRRYTHLHNTLVARHNNNNNKKKTRKQKHHHTKKAFGTVTILLARSSIFASGTKRDGSDRHS